MKKYFIDGQEVRKDLAALIAKDNQNVRDLAVKNPNYREMELVKITVHELEDGKDQATTFTCFEKKYFDEK